MLTPLRPARTVPRDPPAGRATPTQRAAFALLTSLAVLACGISGQVAAQPAQAAAPSAPSAAPTASAPQAAPAAPSPQPVPASQSSAPDAETPTANDPVLAQLAREAEALAPLVATDVARAFLAAVPQLPAPAPRTLWRENATGRFLSGNAAAALDEAARAGFTPRELDAQAYYFTRYGSPLAYARALELLGEAGVPLLAGLRVLDYGYGTVGHLRLAAQCGADAAGVDVDSYLSALYSEPGDHGPVPPAGRVTLHEGRWPAEDAVREAVGEGYDLFLSKNTLKRGYVHPSREADPRHLIDLGVDDATYLARLAELLKPGGLALLYNICPPEAGPEEPWLPWSDGRSPFTREQWEAAGFELLAFDVVDSAAARAQGVALGWGSAEKLEAEIHAWYTLARKRP